MTDYRVRLNQLDYPYLSRRVIRAQYGSARSPRRRMLPAQTALLLRVVCDRLAAGQECLTLRQIAADLDCSRGRAGRAVRDACRAGVLSVSWDRAAGSNRYCLRRGPMPIGHDAPG